MSAIDEIITVLQSVTDELNDVGSTAASAQGEADEAITQARAVADGT